ncbi:HAD family acid phosphatase [Thalassiella azotivora]
MSSLPGRARAVLLLVTTASLALVAPTATATQTPTTTTSVSVETTPAGPTAGPSARLPAGSTAPSASAPPAAPQTLGLPPRDTWLADVSAVTDEATAYLAARLPDPSVRAAVVLDIDNTALQTQYAPGHATPQVLALAQQARADGAAVFFVTSRPEILRPLTLHVLRQNGYPVDGLFMRGWLDFGPDAERKTRARAEIERRGFTVVANVGNSDSDLVGGHAERTFKLPDYDGRLV